MTNNINTTHDQMENYILAASSYVGNSKGAQLNELSASPKLPQSPAA
jgi:hypothetical protein